MTMSTQCSSSWEALTVPLCAYSHSHNLLALSHHYVVQLACPRMLRYADDCDGSHCFSLRYSANTTDPVRFAFALENFKRFALARCAPYAYDGCVSCSRNPSTRRFRGRRPNASALAVLRQEDQGEAMA